MRSRFLATGFLPPTTEPLVSSFTASIALAAPAAAFSAITAASKTTSACSAASSDSSTRHAGWPLHTQLPPHVPAAQRAASSASTTCFRWPHLFTDAPSTSTSTFSATLVRSSSSPTSFSPLTAPTSSGHTLSCSSAAATPATPPAVAAAAASSSSHDWVRMASAIAIASSNVGSPAATTSFTSSSTSANSSTTSADVSTAVVTVAVVSVKRPPHGAALFSKTGASATAMLPMTTVTTWWPVVVDSFVDVADGGEAAETEESANAGGDDTAPSHSLSSSSETCDTSRFSADAFVSMVSLPSLTTLASLLSLISSRGFLLSPLVSPLLLVSDTITGNGNDDAGVGEEEDEVDKEHVAVAPSRPSTAAAGAPPLAVTTSTAVAAASALFNFDSRVGAATLPCPPSSISSLIDRRVLFGVGHVGVPARSPSTVGLPALPTSAKRPSCSSTAATGMIGAGGGGGDSAFFVVEEEEEEAEADEADVVGVFFEVLVAANRRLGVSCAAPDCDLQSGSKGSSHDS